MRVVQDGHAPGCSCRTDAAEDRHCEASTSSIEADSKSAVEHVSRNSAMRDEAMRSLPLKVKRRAAGPPLNTAGDSLFIDPRNGSREAPPSPQWGVCRERAFRPAPRFGSERVATWRIRWRLWD